MIKIASAGLLSLTLILGLANIGSTVSIYNDIEMSLNNFFRADPLEFSVVLATTTIDMSAGPQMLTLVMTPAEESEPVQYYVQAQKISGDDALCNAIEVSSTFPLPYQGALLSLTTGTTTDIGPWTLTASLASGAVAGPAECTLELVYKGWNAGVPEGQGYRDEEHLELTFTLPAEASASAPEEPLVQSEGVVEGASTDSTSSPQAEEPAVLPDAVPATTPEPAPPVPEETTPAPAAAAEPPTETAPAVEAPPEEAPPAEAPAPAEPPAEAPPAE